MLLVLVNPHLENQAIFSKVPTFPGNWSYSNIITKKQHKNIVLFSDGISNRIETYDFNKALENGKANIYFFIELHRNSYSNI